MVSIMDRVWKKRDGVVSLEEVVVVVVVGERDLSNWRNDEVDLEGGVMDSWGERVEEEMMVVGVLM